MASALSGPPVLQGQRLRQVGLRTVVSPIDSKHDTAQAGSSRTTAVRVRWPVQIRKGIVALLGTRMRVGAQRVEVREDCAVSPACDQPCAGLDAGLEFSGHAIVEGAIVIYLRDGGNAVETSSRTGIEAFSSMSPPQLEAPDGAQEFDLTSTATSDWNDLTSKGSTGLK